MDSRFVLRKQPNVFIAIAAGFKTLGERAYLLAFPLILDLTLLFAPRYTVSSLVSRYLAQLTPLTEASAELEQLWTDLSASLGTFFQSYSLSSALRSYPLGVPSLLSGRAFMENPFGKLSEIVVSSEGKALLLLLLFGVLGALLGVANFYVCSLPTYKEAGKQDAKTRFASSAGLLLLPLLFWAALVAVAVPVSLVVSVLSLLHPFLGLLAYFFASMALISMFLPVLFAPHAVLVLQLNLWQGIRASIKLMRPYYSATSLFVILAVLASYLTNMLWQSPGTDSPMVFVGIFGHALVSSALLIASFHYFMRVLELSQEHELAQQTPEASL
ncbi:MAG: hypothetical protein AAGU04_05665 [Anaerolineaceae bacterium]